MKVDIEKMVAEINLMEDAFYTVKDGRISKIKKPETGFGKVIINWQGNKPCMGKLQETNQENGNVIETDYRF